MSVVTLAEAKTHLNITVTTFDTELQAFIDAAEAAIAEKTGPLSSSTKTERVNGGGCGLVLRHTPVVELLSVTPVGGSAYAVGDLMVDNSAGVVEWVSGTRFASGRYDVVYVAGRLSLPTDLKMGVLELVRHTWSASQRGPTRRPGAAASDAQANTLPGSAYLFIYMVMQYISPHIQVGN